MSRTGCPLCTWPRADPSPPDVFFVLTDSDHKAGFKTQCALLARIFELVESGKVQAPLAEGVTDNRAYIRQFCANL